jgi:hypothetical protein
LLRNRPNLLSLHFRRFRQSTIFGFKHNLERIDTTNVGCNRQNSYSYPDLSVARHHCTKATGYYYIEAQSKTDNLNLPAKEKLMHDSVFVIFIAFGCLWVLMGGAAVVGLLKSDGQEIRFGKEGLIVAIPIVIAIIIALVYAAVRR